ncbi:hypothetical protein AC578_3812 [Pseudocercospora eumusae]|uniref:Uncharacterized protein n=1 Tax=Pseudocercospora eumusae TaxID=321146 RepID=A0A139HFQ0_9PEZI|nr:hypothetical protein AC578_3812 [Pseudocercospora eumusae]
MAGSAGRNRVGTTTHPSNIARTVDQTDVHDPLPGSKRAGKMPVHDLAHHNNPETASEQHAPLTQPSAQENAQSSRLRSSAAASNQEASMQTLPVVSHRFKNNALITRYLQRGTNRSQPPLWPNNNDEEELIDLDAAIVPAAAPPSPPAWAQAILAVLDPARQQGPATNMWHSDLALAGPVQFNTFVERGPGYVQVLVLITAPTLVVGRLSVRGLETWPVIADMDW